jgi:hypothetical protein
MKIKKYLPKLLLNTIVGNLTLLGMILLPILYTLHVWVLNLVIQKKTQSLISWILLALLWLLLLELVALIVLTHKRKALGLYWDRDNNAYCPVCKTLCTYKEHYEGRYGSFYCAKCKHSFIPTTKQGVQLNYEDVIYGFQHKRI